MSYRNKTYVAFDGDTDMQYNAKQMVLLVGEKTKGLRKFVPWEIELARKQDIPIIVVNLNGKRGYDPNRCPSTIGSDVYTMHVAFYAKIIKLAMDDFAKGYDAYKNNRPGNYRYPDSVYKELGLI